MNHLWYGSRPVLPGPPASVFPFVLSFGRDSSMTVIGVIKTTQQPFSSVAFLPSLSLPLSLSPSLPLGVTDIQTELEVAFDGAAWRRTKSIMQEEGRTKEGPWSGAGKRARRKGTCSLILISKRAYHPSAFCPKGRFISWEISEACSRIH